METFLQSPGTPPPPEATPVEATVHSREAAFLQPSRRRERGRGTTSQDAVGGLAGQEGVAATICLRDPRRLLKQIFHGAFRTPYSPEVREPQVTGGV